MKMELGDAFYDAFLRLTLIRSTLKSSKQRIWTLVSSQLWFLWWGSGLCWWRKWWQHGKRRWRTYHACKHWMRIPWRTLWGRFEWRWHYRCKCLNEVLAHYGSTFGACPSRRKYTARIGTMPWCQSQNHHKIAWAFMTCRADGLARPRAIAAGHLHLVELKDGDIVQSKVLIQWGY